MVSTFHFRIINRRIFEESLHDNKLQILHQMYFGSINGHQRIFITFWTMGLA